MGQALETGRRVGALDTWTKTLTPRIRTVCLWSLCYAFESLYLSSSSQFSLQLELICCLNQPVTFKFSVFYFSFLEEGMQTTPVFLPGESHGQRSLVGYSPWGCKGSDTTERLSTAQHRSLFGSLSDLLGFIYLFTFSLALWHVEWGILVPCQGIEPAPPALEAQNVNHWTNRKVLCFYFYNFLFLAYVFKLLFLYRS